MEGILSGIQATTELPLKERPSVPVRRGRRGRSLISRPYDSVDLARVAPSPWSPIGVSGDPALDVGPFPDSAKPLPLTVATSRQSELRLAAGNHVLVEDHLEKRRR